MLPAKLIQRNEDGSELWESRSTGEYTLIPLDILLAIEHQKLERAIRLTSHNAGGRKIPTTKISDMDAISVERKLTVPPHQIINVLTTTPTVGDNTNDKFVSLGGETTE